MFASTVDQVVKALGAGVLHGVKNVSTANEVVPFGVVVKEKKRKFLVLKKFLYSTTEFTLQDVLKSDCPDLQQLLSSRTIVDFLRMNKFTLKGKLGAELKKELAELDVNGDDSVTCQADLGDLEQVDVEVNELMKVLEGRKVNLRHPLVEGLLQEAKTRTMCVITSVVRVKNTTILSCVSNKDFSEKLVVLKEEEDLELDESKTRKMVLPAGTALAYGVHELRVDMRSGDVQLVPLNSEPGGFVIKHESLSTFYTDAEEGTATEEDPNLAEKPQPTDGKTEPEHEACEASAEKELVAEAEVHPTPASDPESGEANRAGSETEPSPGAAGEASPDAEKAESSEAAPSTESKTETAMEGTETTSDAQMQTGPTTTEAEADTEVKQDTAGDDTKPAEAKDTKPTAGHSHGSEESGEDQEYHSACSDSRDTSDSEVAPDWEMVTVAEVHASREEEPKASARTQPDGGEEEGSDDTKTLTAREEEEPRTKEETQSSAAQGEPSAEEGESSGEEEESSGEEEESNAEEEEEPSADEEEESCAGEEEESGADEEEESAEEMSGTEEEEARPEVEGSSHDEEESSGEEEELSNEEEAESTATKENPSTKEENPSTEEEAQSSAAERKPSTDEEAQTTEAEGEPSTETKAKTPAEDKKPVSTTETPPASEEKESSTEKDAKTESSVAEAGASSDSEPKASAFPHKPSTGVELAAQLLTGQLKLE